MVPMLPDWNRLSEPLQMALSHEAMRRAVELIAEQAETLACEMEAGRLADRGGPDALRLFAAVMRVSGAEPLVPAGHA